jgi:hypothetical protein
VLRIRLDFDHGLAYDGRRMSESELDHLWREYGAIFRDFDDLSLARWCSQTLSQMQGRAWRLSHPLVGCYRLAARQAHDRQIWLKRLVNMPTDYTSASCCRAPLLPLFTRDILETGLMCQHCGDVAIRFEEIPEELQNPIRVWAKQYAPIHEVAHWDAARRLRCDDYEDAFEKAANEAEKLLVEATQTLIPRFLDFCPTILWEDQDECLEVGPDDIRIETDPT